MDALFTAFDTSGLFSNLSTILVVGAGILLLFVGYRFLKRTAYELGYGPAISPWEDEVQGTGYAPLNPNWNEDSYYKRQTSKSIRRHGRKHG